MGLPVSCSWQPRFSVQWCFSPTFWGVVGCQSYFETLTEARFPGVSELYESKCLAKLDGLGTLGYCFRRKLESGNVIPMSPSGDRKFLDVCFLNWKQLFILKGFFLCMCLMYSVELKWKQTFRLSRNNFTGNSSINFHSDLAEGRRFQSPEPFIKSNLRSLPSFRVCPTVTST